MPSLLIIAPQLRLNHYNRKGRLDTFPTWLPIFYFLILRDTGKILVGWIGEYRTTTDNELVRQPVPHIITTWCRYPNHNYQQVCAGDNRTWQQQGTEYYDRYHNATWVRWVLDLLLLLSLQGVSILLTLSSLLSLQVRTESKNLHTLLAVVQVMMDQFVLLLK